MTETYGEAADADDIARHWPDGREAPGLILDVARFARGMPWLSLGATRLVGDRMDDHWIENGADLWRDFGCFMRLPDGSRVALWLRDALGASEPPVVLIDSEGGLVVLAASLASFLAAWALSAFDGEGHLVADTGNGRIQVALPSDLIRVDDEDEAPDERAALAAYLGRQLGRDPGKLLLPKPDDTPLVAFFNAWGAQARAELAASPNLQAIAERLHARIPRGRKPWERKLFRVAAAGGLLEVGAGKDAQGRLSPEEVADIRPFIQAEREARAGGVHAPRGLWHSAALILHPDGSSRIAADWSAEPRFSDGTEGVDAAIAADLVRFPRSPRWIEPWMTRAR